MSFKTITISDDVYDLLVSLKKSGESFTDLLRRLGMRARDESSLDEFAGIWAGPEFDVVERKVLDARVIDRRTARSRSKRLGLR